MSIFKKIYDYFFNNRRKKKIIDGTTQTQMAVEMLLHIVMFISLIVFVLYVDPLATLFSPYSLNDHQQAVHWLFEVNSGKWPLLIGAMLVLGLVSIHFSHRISGPAFKIEMMLKKYALRDLKDPTYLRTHDYLVNIASAVNEVRNVVASDLKGLHQMLETLDREITLLPEGASKVKLKSLLGELVNKVNLYNVENSEAPTLNG